MIDLIANFANYEKKIFDCAAGNKEGYFNSDCYDKLKTRCERLKDSYNLRIGSGNWKSKIVLPILKEQMRMTRALTLQYFRPEPPYSLEPILDTPYENAQNLTLVCSMNLKSTEWRRKVWRPLVHSASILGTGVVYGYYHEAQTSERRTVTGPLGVDKRVVVDRTTQQVRHDNLDILNYFQNPTAIDPEDSDFQGHIDLVTLSELVSGYQQDQGAYIKDNLAKVIREAQGGTGAKDNRYSADNIKDNSNDRVGLHRTRYWGKLNFKGNEDDPTIYYIEWVGNTIIRMQAEVYDCNVSPYSIYNYEKRHDFWWGNADSENLLPHENYMNLLMSITADAALQTTQRIRLYQKGQLKPADINNMAINDGFVPVDGLMSGQKLSDLVYELQHSPRDLSSTDYMTREMKESMQRMSMKPDLTRQAAQGGMQNKTATAANILEERSNVMTSDFLESFSYGLMQQGKFDSIVLQQMLGGEIKVRPDVKQASKVLTKPEILGDYSYVVKTALETGTLARSQKLLQDITQFINFKGTGLQEFQALNITKLLRDYIKTLELPDDIDEYYPAQQAMQTQPGYQQSQLPQQAQKAMVQGGIPQATPQPTPTGGINV